MLNTRTLIRGSAFGLSLWALGAAARNRFGYQLEGKTALVTGGSRGLGLVLARHFAEAGMNVAICARDETELARARKDLLARGRKILALRCDLTDRAQVEDMVQTAMAYFGRVDVLVNNAGIIQVGPAEHMTVGDYDEAMAVNFHAALFTTMAVLPEMKRRGSGRIVNIASIGARVPIPHLAPYTASKFALAGWSQALHAEVAKDGVKVITVCPGLMRTGSPPNVFFKGRAEDEYKWFALGSATPLSAMSVDRAARKILNSIRIGRPFVTLSVQAKLLGLAHGLFPGAFGAGLSLVNRLLPPPGGLRTRAQLGKRSESAFTNSWVFGMLKSASRRNNEI